MPIPSPLQAKVAEAPAAPVPPAMPMVAQPGPFTSLSVLGEQVASYAQQLAGLKAQRSVLQRQISNSNDAATRAGLELRRVPLDKAIQQTELDLASARAQLLSRQGGIEVRTGFPPPPNRRQFDPDLAAGLMFAFIGAVLMPIAIAIARRIWRGNRETGRAIEDRVSPRLDRLEQAVDAIAIEVERISEGQRFVTKVLTDRPIPARSPSSQEGNDVSPIAEAKPLRALGAGPIEPIRVPERQAVRQAVTPH